MQTKMAENSIIRVMSCGQGLETALEFARTTLRLSLSLFLSLSSRDGITMTARVSSARD